MFPSLLLDIAPPFWSPDFGDNFENVILHFSMSTQKGLRFETEALIKPLLLNGDSFYFCSSAILFTRFSIIGMTLSISF